MRILNIWGFRHVIGAFRAKLSDFAECRRGNILVITAITLPVAIGAAGLGIDVSNWYLTQRSMQNAADAAAQAAATNASTNYDVEAKAVTALYGYVDGANNVAVTASNTAACPSGGNNCYSVTISSVAPTFLAQLVGYAGSSPVTTIENGVTTTKHETLIVALAIAKQGPTPRQYCILALGSSGATGIRTNGSSKANLSGCDVMSDTGATCNGSDTNADHADAHGTNNGCGVIKRSNVAVVPDPYSGLASNIPADTTCAGSFPQEPGKQGPSLPSSNLWSGIKGLSGNVTVCGDLQLSGDVTINTPGSGAVLIIRNGQLDTNGHTIRTSNGSGLTVVFTGSNAGGYTHAPTGGGTIDIAAPTDMNSKWHGVAIYQDPSLTSGVDISAAGNSPAWNITGLVYLPHSSVTFSGIVNKATNGKSCFALVVDNITVNGAAQILPKGECTAAGLTMPTGSAPGRGTLVG